MMNKLKEKNAQYLNSFLMKLSFIFVVFIFSSVNAFADIISFSSSNPSTQSSNFAIPSTNQIIYQGVIELDVFN